MAHRVTNEAVFITLEIQGDHNDPTTDAGKVRLAFGRLHPEASLAELPNLVADLMAKAVRNETRVGLKMIAVDELQDITVVESE